MIPAPGGGQIQQRPVGLMPALGVRKTLPPVVVPTLPPPIGVVCTGIGDDPSGADGSGKDDGGLSPG